jgi:flagellar M-ring protein FliF
MNKLSEMLKNLIGRWKGLSTRRKIAFTVIFVGVIAAIISISISLNTTTYAVLFANMDSKDASAVYTDLNSKKVKVKIQGNTILVPKDQVDELRMQVLSDVTLTDGSQGFELLDKSQFGQTDAQMKINYQRALQGELERTIKTFSQVAGARVSLVIPDDSDFVRDTTPGKAFVTVKLKPNEKLTTDQVMSIVSLVSGSVKNLPKENVEVTDTVTLLTKNLFNKDGQNLDASTSTEKQQQLTTQYENEVQQKLQDMLETIYGKDKVKVVVNADLNFDDTQKKVTTYDPKNVPVSEQTETDATPNANTQNSGSPVDNNMVNGTSSTTTTSNGITTEKRTTNYNVSTSEEKTIKAPGEVNRLTTSVVIDGKLDDAAKSSVKNLVVSAVGYDAARGDTISVESMAFDTTAQDNAKKDLDSINQEITEQKRKKMYELIGAGVACLLITLLIASALRKKVKDTEKEQDMELQPKGLDVVIGDQVKELQEAAEAKEQTAEIELPKVQPKEKFKPVELDVENEQMHVESEIRKYAANKPEQVAEIIKTWMAEDER